MNIPLPTLTGQPKAPSLTVLFRGVMLFVFGPPIAPQQYGHCSVGFLDPDDEHRLKLSYGSMPSASALTPRYNELIPIPEAELPGDSYLEVARAVSQVTAYAGDEAASFGLVADLEGANFHQRKLTPKPAGIAKRLFLKNGALFTAYRHQVAVMRGKESRVIEAAHIVGCNLYLEADQTVTLTLPQRTLAFVHQPDVTQLLYVDTHCPNQAGNFNDFRHYYNAYEVPADEQFMMDRPPRAQTQFDPGTGEPPPSEPDGGDGNGDPDDPPKPIPCDPATGG